MIKKYKHKNKSYYLIQLSYTDSKGKRHQPKFRKDKSGQRITSERAARLLEYEYLNDLIAQVEGDLSQLTFREWHLRFLEMIKLQYMKSTVSMYNGDLLKWLPEDFKNSKLSNITKLDVHSLIFETLPANGASPNLQRKTRRVLHKIFEVALDHGLIKKNPAKGIEVKVPPPKRLVLNHDEVVKFLAEAKRVNHSFYYHWCVVFFSGLRNGELYGLRWSDIDLVSGNINVRGQWTNKDGFHPTKSNRNRVIPISSELKKILLELKRLGPFSELLTGLNGNNQYFDDLVLPRSSEWKHGEQSKITKSFCKLIGITEVRFHDLRATFITNALAQGVSTPIVMSIVGHARMSTTDEYLRLAGVNVKGATDKVSYSLPKLDDNNVIPFGEAEKL